MGKQPPERRESKQLFVRVLGSGDPFGSGGRNSSGYLVEAGSTRILLDCGPTTVASLKRFLIDTATIQAILITHYHGDHVGGLPFLFHDYQYSTRRATPLTVAGPPGLRHRVDRVYDALYPGVLMRPRRYRVRYRELAEEVPFKPPGTRGIKVLPFRVRHQPRRRNFGYRLEAFGRRIVYTGDTEWFEDLCRFSQGADMFLCECTERVPRTPGHLNLETLRANRRRLGARRVVLTHLGRGMEGVGRVSGFQMARDGQLIKV